MGLFDWLTGGSSRPEQIEDWDESEWITTTEDGYTKYKFDQFFFLDQWPGDKDNVLNLRLIIGPHGEREGWGVLRCNEDIYVPPGTEIYAVKHGHMIMTGDKPWVATLGKLVHPDEEFEGLDMDSVADEFYRFPEELTGVEIPEGGEWSDEELEVLCWSLMSKSE